MRLERLTCRERVDLLCGYLDENLPPSRRKLVAGHRRSCRPCSELLASLQKTVRTLKALKARSKPPASARAALRAALSRPARR